MRATVIHAPRDIRLDEVDEPGIIRPTDAVVRVVRSCVCGSDLWPYRGINAVKKPRRIGHEFIGVIETAGEEVELAEGQFVIGPFTWSCGECVHCRAGWFTSCLNGGGYGGKDRNDEFVDGCQGEALRVPQADGTLVPVGEPGEMPDEALLASLLTCSDVMGTGWHAATMAGVEEGDTVVVVGDGAVGLCAVLAARMKGAGRIIAMSRHEARQRIAAEFGATDIVTERGEEGIARIKELTDGVGADRVLECVGTNDSMQQALGCARPGGMVGYVGVPHDIEMPMNAMFSSNVGVRGGVAPVREYLPMLRDAVLAGEIEPGKVFDLELPLDDVAEAYRAMDERRAIKVMLRP